MTGTNTILRRLRREREIPIAVLSKQTGINASALSLIERGLYNTTKEQKTKLARYFKRPFDELMRDPAQAAA